MKKNWLIGVIIIFSGCHIAGTVPPSTIEKTRSLVLFDFEGDFDLDAVETTDSVQVSLTKTEKGNTLRITIGDEEQRPTVVLKSAEGHWDLSQFLYVAMDVRNQGTNDVLVTCRLDNHPWVDGGVAIPAEASKTLTVLIKRPTPPEHFAKFLFGMNGMPGGYVPSMMPINLRKIKGLFVSFPAPQAEHTIEIDNIRATGSYEPATLEELRSSMFPLIDTFGQYIHKDWPGKTHSVEDLDCQREKEASDLAKHPSPSDWNAYGGWTAGPQLEATGHFRVEKYQDKWWFVDPEGRLFWSHGINCVHAGFFGTHFANEVGTPITDRQKYFEELPALGSDFAQFYGTGSVAPHGYYKDKGEYKTYKFSLANLFHKYCENWLEVFTDITHKRLRSWGMNTIGSWSEGPIYLARKTPYVEIIDSGGPRIEGAWGYWGKFPDPFDPVFSQLLWRQLKQALARTVDDPWCIGYFIDTELTWGWSGEGWSGELHLALGTLQSPAEQAAKKAFVEDLKAKYENIDNLNKAWGTRYGSWRGMLQSRKEPDEKKAYTDLASFSRRIAEKYFQVCSEAVKGAAPNKLYLGCRFGFHWYPEVLLGEEWPLSIAAKYCDVISFNRSRYSSRALRPPEGIDKPVIIGGFHFGALDRGMFHTGLRSVFDQAERGQAYIRYVREGLENPYLVGTHWFQYRDQPTTGRGDGENYQVGFIDICDTPYPETIAACREVGYKMYEYRMEN
jgi:hypothetical protein